MRKTLLPWTYLLFAALNANCAKPSFAPDGIILPTDQGAPDAAFLAGMSSTDLWALARFGFFHWNGKSWTQLPSVSGWANAAPDANAVWLGAGPGVEGETPVENSDITTQGGFQAWQSGMVVLAQLSADGTVQDFTADFSPAQDGSYWAIPRVFAGGTIAVFESSASAGSPGSAPIVYRLQSGHFVAGETLPQGFVFLWAGSPDDVWGFSDSTMSQLVHDVDGTLTMFSVPAVPNLMTGEVPRMGAPLLTSSSDVWLPLNTGSPSDSSVGHWDGSQWTWQLPTPPVPPTNYAENVIGYAPVSPGVLAVFSETGALEGQPLDPNQILARNWNGTGVSYSHLIKWCPAPLQFSPSLCEGAGGPDMLADGTAVIPVNGALLPTKPDEW